ncbi:hypothetical protein [Mesorhizobium sp. dw_380]|uniref:hypothetical protein n=1 Tax=Mesorhizobium sp. dw_380 TaxID=2812001 RepID=UPI001BDE6A0F|nr:hypothetical protein [Mesorhizobium sp. dw_380]
MQNSEIRTVSNWARLSANDLLIAADIADQLSLVAADNDNVPETGRMQSAGARDPQAPEVNGITVNSITVPGRGGERMVALFIAIYMSPVFAVALLLLAVSAR